MNSMERVMAAMNQQEPDRVPLFLLFSTYGAKELGLSIKEYFSKPEYVVEAQLRLRNKFDSDCLTNFFYAALQIEAFGGEVIFRDEVAPNSGEPFLKSIEEIAEIELPSIEQSEPLKRVLRVTSLLQEAVKDAVPIIGSVVSPFSLPVMQLGFEKYLELLYFRKDEFEMLMRLNEEFCVAWANAQLAAGATAIGYSDPLASPEMIERDTYLQTGHKVAQRTISRIKGPVATQLASARALPVVDDIAKTGSVGVGFSAADDLAAIKAVARNKICLIGNLNGLEMINWDAAQARREVKKVIRQVAPGGGFILADNLGEIPWHVPEEILLEISEAAKEFGTYPIQEGY